MGSLALIAARDAGDDDRLCLVTVTLERGSMNFYRAHNCSKSQFQFLIKQNSRGESYSLSFNLPKREIIGNEMGVFAKF